MIPLFLGLTALNLLCLGAAAALGYAYGGDRERGQWHMLVGATATLVCCAVHCVVFTYFAATSKWVQHAVRVKGLDPALSVPTRSFKAHAFPAAMAAIATGLLAAFSGAYADAYGFPGATATPHGLLAWGALAGNAGAAWVEYRAIARNGRLIDEVLKRIESAGASGSPSPFPLSTG
jgi:hypothetical protein